jgi:hypothetical protein
MSDLQEHAHFRTVISNDPPKAEGVYLHHRHAQYDRSPHEHSALAMTEAGLGDQPSGPVVEVRR